MDIKFSLTLIVSFGALLFSFLNYKRGRRSENENYLYKSKVEIYLKVQAEIIGIISRIQEDYFEVQKYHENPSEEGTKYLNNRADYIDKMCFDFANSIVEISLLIPDRIFAPLSVFCEKLLNSDYLDIEIGAQSEIFEKLKEIINGFVDESEKISNLLRDDLHIEQLNVSLFNRLK